MAFSFFHYYSSFYYSPNPKLTPKALFILFITFISSICPIFSFSLLLSIVLICSVSTIESVFNWEFSGPISICVGNLFFPIWEVIAAAITSQMGKNKLPTHIEIGPENSQLKTESIVLTEQIRTIDKSRLKEKIGHIDDENVMNKINNALGVSFGL